MSLIDDLRQLERDADAQIQILDLWQLPFQAIVAQMFFTIELIDHNNRGDTAMDYSSRLAYIYPLIAEKAAKAVPDLTVNSITGNVNAEATNDIKFLNAYAHLSLLMPQIHRGLFRLSGLTNQLHLDYLDQAAEDAEIHDRMLALISTPMVISYEGADEFNTYLREKVRRGITSLYGEDFARVQHIKDFYERTTFSIKPLSDAAFEEVFGLTYEQFNSFAATVRAFAELFIGLGRAHYDQIEPQVPKETDDHHMGEYMEWTSCCLNKDTLRWYLHMSGLSAAQFKNLMGYYLNIYSDTTQDGYIAKGHCGDGCFPPFVWMDDQILFSPHATKYLLTVNNLLYSYNKKDPQAFADRISQNLEPCLIRQLSYLFRAFPGILIRENVEYGLSEIDLVVYSPVEKTALCFQAKATIAPDSARTVRRVEQRALEGIGQIKLFETLPKEEQEQLIRNVFGVADTDIRFQHFLAVRSCAGSREIWQQNAQYPITNYSLLGYIIAGKLNDNEHSLARFSQEVHAALQELRQLAAPEIIHETLPILGRQVTFPDINLEPGFMARTYTRILKVFPDFEQIS